jgi:type II secretory pathway predicted ATPase ExeA
MYQSPFGLSRRPFSSTPDPNCVVPVGGMPEALSELEHCARDGQGIGILTAPAGLGKTILCRKLADNLRSQFSVFAVGRAGTAPGV